MPKRCRSDSRATDPAVAPGAWPEPFYAYPVDVCTDAERHRWDLCIGISLETFGGGDRLLTFMTAGAIYRSDMPT
jgi:hypothetical protein